jgi:hypothetical protein
MSRIIPITNIEQQYEVQRAHVINIVNGFCIVIVPITDDELNSISLGKIPKYLNDIPTYHTSTKLIATGDPLDASDFKDELDIMVGKLLDDKTYYIPKDFNLNTRTFNMTKPINGEPFISWVERNRVDYYKYCLSLIGNPSNITVLKIEKRNYQESNYYKSLKHES